MTKRHFLRILESEADKAPTRWRAAERLGISESMLSRVLSGKLEPNDALLARFHLRRQVVYVSDIPKTTESVNSQVVDNSD
jgi:hypothetical protein